MRFYLGTTNASWLRRAKVPLFVSARSLRRKSRLPQAFAPWALDSGGFTELSLYGEWRTPPEQYAREVADWSKRIGMMRWAAIQDWMCEPFMIEKTGLSVKIHQRRTIESYLHLDSINPEVNWLPVIQGYKKEEYMEHYFMYRDAGIRLDHLPSVGLGSICRRQGTIEAMQIARSLWQMGVKLHGFGLKKEGLRIAARYFKSADSMAWSLMARRGKPLPGCKHARCSGCIKYAMKWREGILSAIEEGMR